MESKTPTRQEAYDLLTTYTKTDSLRKHALAVEGVMRYMARKYGEDEEKWGVIGLVHDLDYEQFPEIHCQKTEEILQEQNWPEEYIRAVLSHAYGMMTDVKPKHHMEKVLYTIDELTGLVNAAALVRPSQSVMDMKPKSIKKKWNSKTFAAGVDRTVIENGAAMLEKDLNEIIADTIAGMQEVADDIGLGRNG